jgi:hypothetical protein
MSKYKFELERHATDKVAPITEFPSVTTILGDMMAKPFLMQWARNLACDYIKAELEKVMAEGDSVADALVEIIEGGRKASKAVSDTALDVGSQVHKLIELHINKEELPTDALANAQVSAAFAAFLEWEAENIDEWGKSEMTVFSNLMRVAGTLDAVAIIKGKLYVIDFKTSGGFYDEYPPQLAAYAMCFEEMHNVIVEGIGVLRLDKETGKPYWKDYSADMDRYKMVFTHLAAAWWGLKKRRLKYNGDINKESYNVTNDKTDTDET